MERTWRADDPALETTRSGRAGREHRAASATGARRRVATARAGVSRRSLDGGSGCDSSSRATRRRSPASTASSDRRATRSTPRARVSAPTGAPDWRRSVPHRRRPTAESGPSLGWWPSFEAIDLDGHQPGAGRARAGRPPPARRRLYRTAPPARVRRLRPDAAYDGGPVVDRRARARARLGVGPAQTPASSTTLTSRRGCANVYASGSIDCGSPDPLSFDRPAMAAQRRRTSRSCRRATASSSPATSTSSSACARAPTSRASTSTSPARSPEPRCHRSGASTGQRPLWWARRSSRSRSTPPANPASGRASRAPSTSSPSGWTSTRCSSIRWCSIAADATCAVSPATHSPFFGVEQRGRVGWTVCWALPLAADGTPHPLEDEDVLHAPTATAERLALPARLVASVPVEPDRRRVRPGPATDRVLAAAAATYVDLVRAVAPDHRVALVPAAGFPRSEPDGRLRELVMDELRAAAWLPGADGGELAPSRAQELDVPNADGLAELLASSGAFPGLLAPVAPVPRELGVRRLGAAEMAERLLDVRRPPSWWRAVYAALDPAADTVPGLRDELRALSVPLGDGRVVAGPATVLLPAGGCEAVVGVAALGLPGLHVAHPDAVHPLLARLGARPAEPAALLAHPALRAAVERSVEDAEAGLDPAPLAAAVLGLVGDVGYLDGPAGARRARAARRRRPPGPGRRADAARRRPAARPRGGRARRGARRRLGRAVPPLHAHGRRRARRVRRARRRGPGRPRPRPRRRGALVGRARRPTHAPGRRARSGSRRRRRVARGTRAARRASRRRGPR